MNSPVLSGTIDNPFDEFNYWWNLSGKHVEEPNVRRGGWSGVKRSSLQFAHPVYIKQQVNHNHRSILHPFGRPTILREVEGIKACRKHGIRTLDLLFYGNRRQRDGHRAMMVTRELKNYISLKDWLASCPEQQQHLDRVLREMARTIARFNNARWQHGSLYAKHIFVKISADTENAPRVKVALIDLEKSRRRLTRNQASRHDIAQLGRHSELTEAAWKTFLNYYRLYFDDSANLAS